ncbi:MAG TPA: hypothetical protein VKD26_04155 [Streptosporangiaceae bacterium]|nr:hypothetical protein [Streptosporangiaceae bacterium]
MNGRLRIDITERQRPVAFQHPLSRQLTSGNLAKQAIGHPMIVAVVPAGGEPAPCAGVGICSEAATGGVSEPILFSSMLAQRPGSYRFLYRDTPARPATYGGEQGQ